MPECSGAPNESKPARLNSRPITASCAKLPPTPPYSSGIARQSSPATPALVHTSRSYMPSSHQRSMCGANSAPMKRRACSSSSARSSVIQAGRGRLSACMAGPVLPQHTGPRTAARGRPVDMRRQAALSTSHWVLATRLAVYTVADMRGRDERIVDYEHLLLPFGRDTEAVDRILAALETVSPEGAFEHRDTMRSALEPPPLRSARPSSPENFFPLRRPISYYFCSILAAPRNNLAPAVRGLVSEALNSPCVPSTDHPAYDVASQHSAGCDAVVPGRSRRGGGGAARGTCRSDPRDGDRAADRHRAQFRGRASVVPARHRVLPQNDIALGGRIARLADCARRDRGARIDHRDPGRRRDGDDLGRRFCARARLHAKLRLRRARRRRDRNMRRLRHARDLDRAPRLQGQGGRRRLRGGRRQCTVDLGDAALSADLQIAWIRS